MVRRFWKHAQQFMQPKGLSWRAYLLFGGIVLVYLPIAVALYNKTLLGVAGDTHGYEQAAALPITQAAFWQHWRFATLVFALKIFGRNYDLIAAVQLVCSLAAWLIMAAVTARLIHHKQLRIIGFGLVLFFSLNIDFFLWHRIILTESLDNTLILLLISAFLLLHQRLREAKAFPLRQQIGASLGFGVLIFLWDFSRPPNYINALLVLGAVLAGMILWRRSLQGKWLVISLIAATLLAAYLVRNRLVNDANAWQNGFINNLSADILPYPEKRAFFAERGMPTDAAALHFAGYVPANYGGDWEAVFGEWINTRGRRAYLEYLLLKPADHLRELAQNWQKLIDPEILTDLYGRSTDHFLADWQLENTGLLYNGSGISFLVLAGLSLGLGLPRIVQRKWDWRWLVPLLLILTTLPMIVLNWHSNVYETRHFVANGLKVRLGILLIALFCADRFLLERRTAPQSRWRTITGSLMLLTLAIEILCGYTFTRNQVAFPILSRLAPNQNLLRGWGVTDLEYRLYRYAELDEPIMRIRTEVFDDPYTRFFVVRWGEYDASGEVWDFPEGLAFAWRTSPQPIAAAGPQGAVYGPLYLEPAIAQGISRWRDSMLPGRLKKAAIDLVYVEDSAWEYLPPYQVALLQNPTQYRLLQRWEGNTALYRTADDALEWADLAADTPQRLWLSEPTYALYQQHVRQLDWLPPEAAVFIPATGAAADRPLTLATLSGIIEAYDQNSAARTRLFDLLAVLDRARYQHELPLDRRQQAALEAWRTSKQPDDLLAAGFEYLLFDETWWLWLSTEEQATLSDASQYELVTEWQGIIPSFYRLYRIVK